MEKFGKFLVKKNVVTEFELGLALELRQKNGAELERILITEGYANSYQLYQALADYEDVEFADLSKNPCESYLLDSTLRKQYFDLNLIPWKKEGDITVIATSKINNAAEYWASKQYGDDYKFAITSPYDIYFSINTFFSEEDDADARERLWLSHPGASSKDIIGGKRLQYLLIFLAILVVVGAWKLPLLVLFMTMVLSLLLLFPMLISLGHLLKNVISQPVTKHVNSDDAEAFVTDERDLPLYTILVPLLSEEYHLANIVQSLRNIDYPKAKLDIKLIVEQDDQMTINAIKDLKCERIFEIIHVPQSFPKTKYKACNYALRFAKGSFVTVYGSACCPEVLQLRKVVDKFREEGFSASSVRVVQAHMDYYVDDSVTLDDESVLDAQELLHLIKLGKIESVQGKAYHPVALASNSYHFRTTDLQELEGWDPYNYSEDADLGMRLAKNGWKIATINSTTSINFTLSTKQWHAKQVRLAAGGLQSFCIHVRDFLSWAKGMNFLAACNLWAAHALPALIALFLPLIVVVWSICAIGLVHAEGLLGHMINLWVFTAPVLALICVVSYCLIGYCLKHKLSGFFIALRLMRWRYSHFTKAWSLLFTRRDVM